MSVIINEEGTLYTPRRAQKCLFGIKNSSRRKTICRNENDGEKNDISSGDESDLGPMSPLACNDRSPASCDSSPDSQCSSPLTTPKRLTRNTNASNNQTLRRSFSALNKITRTARYSPQQGIATNTKSCVQTKPLINSNPETPKHLSKTAIILEQVIPETPHRHFGRELQNDIIETPNKNKSPEHKLITPLGSESKMIPLPKLNRRKSFSALDGNIDFSPKRRSAGFKRHAYEQLENSTSKLLKLDENSPVPKARAALFQEKSSEEKIKNFTLSTARFYSSSEKKKEPKENNEFIEHVEKKRSPPAHSTNHRRSFKKNKMGEINAGVSHGIKKPKVKPNSESLKRNISDIQQNVNTDEIVPLAKKIKKTSALTVPPEKTLSPEIDPNKRFFKTKRSLDKHHSTNLTAINKVKPKITAHRKLTLNHNKLEQKNFQSSKQSNTQNKAVEMAFDTTDLIMDEPEYEVSIEESKVANILKVLEDDWADDDYDTMEILTDPTSLSKSPIKTLTILKDVTMSPASELSNMTSTMNIKDVSVSTVENDLFNDTENNTKQLDSTQMYYPLFNKGYSMNKTSENVDRKKTPHSMKENKNVNWQLTMKRGGGENQYQLDAGQKYFGATQCAECGIVYQLGEPEDENAHLNYHNSKQILKFPGWKTERVVMEDPYTKSRVIMVESDDSKLYWNKVSDILAVVDRDLGLSDSKITNYQQKKVYLYIRDKSVLGVLVAEYIKTAHRMIPELLELDCCSAESTPAKCGINVVWTAMSHRKQGIATKMVNLLRTQFYYGYVMSLDDIAFSIPTPSGKIFAEKYTKTRNFKVYS